MREETDAFTEQLQKLAEDLRAVGYRGQVGDGRVLSSITGYEVELFIFPNRSLQLSTGFELGDDVTFGVGEVNEFNSTYRFSKAFVDDEGDVILVSDFLHDLDDERRGAQLKRMLLLHEVSLGFLTDAFDKAEEAQEGTRYSDEGATR